MARQKNLPRSAKTQAILDYPAQRKRAKAADVVAGLFEKRITVTPIAVYNLKARKRMVKRHRRAEADGQVVGFSISHLLGTRQLVKSPRSID